MTRVSITIEFETESPKKLSSAFQKMEIDKRLLGTIISTIKRNRLYFTRYDATKALSGITSKGININISDIKP